jgi:glycerol transport system ATP-binding protein
MAKIEMRNISHSYLIGAKEQILREHRLDERFVIKELTLAWEDGTANALLGPSGCGKTTILNIISGLLRPTIGTIFFDGRDVTVLSPEERHIAQVFQFPVVYDTMSVFKNLAFPLSNAGMRTNEIKRKVGEVADFLDLNGVLYKSAGKISQADKQKVSLGRGIVREDTVAILLDEPLTVIDPKEKYVLRRKLREVQKELKITTVYVTHDQHEALTFADNVTVLKDGQIIQTGTPEQLHAEPESPFIGYFIGSPGMNLLECTLKENVLDFREFRLPISARMKAALNPHGSDFQFGIRPEFVRTSKQEKQGWIPWGATVVEDIGSHKVLTLASNGIQIKSRASEDMRVSVGDRIWVSFPEEQVKIFKEDKRVY